MSQPEQERSQFGTPRGVGTSVERQADHTAGVPVHHSAAGSAQPINDGREHGLDTTLSETFPCSDPLSSIPNPTSYSV
jgi:hypothetical protein